MLWRVAAATALVMWTCGAGATVQDDKAAEVRGMMRNGQGAELCRQIFAETFGSRFCWDTARRAVRERYPVAVVDWQGCADRGAAEAWAWSALAVKGDYPVRELSEVRRACEPPPGR